jgi:hypothetical protein
MFHAALLVLCAGLVNGIPAATSTVTATTANPTTSPLLLTAPAQPTPAKHGAPSLPMVEDAEPPATSRNRRSGIATWEVEFAGKIYGTLTKVDPHNSGEFTCQGQGTYLPLPEGAILAPDTTAVRTNVVAKYGWTTHVLVLASGVGYYTGHDAYTPGGEQGTIYTSDTDLRCVGDTYAVSGCNLQILYERPPPVTTTTATTTTSTTTTATTTTIKTFTQEEVDAQMSNIVAAARAEEQSIAAAAADVAAATVLKEKDAAAQAVAGKEEAVALCLSELVACQQPEEGSGSSAAGPFPTAQEANALAASDCNSSGGLVALIAILVCLCVGLSGWVHRLKQQQKTARATNAAALDLGDADTRHATVAMVQNPMAAAVAARNLQTAVNRTFETQADGAGMGERAERPPPRRSGRGGGGRGGASSLSPPPPGPPTSQPEESIDYEEIDESGRGGSSGGGDAYTVLSAAGAVYAASDVGTGRSGGAHDLTNAASYSAPADSHMMYSSSNGDSREQQAALYGNDAYGNVAGSSV